MKCCSCCLWCALFLSKSFVCTCNWHFYFMHYWRVQHSHAFLQNTTFHEPLNLTTFAWTNAMDIICIHSCNWQLLYALSKLISTIAIKYHCTYNCNWRMLYFLYNFFALTTFFEFFAIDFLVLFQLATFVFTIAINSFSLHSWN